MDDAGAWRLRIRHAVRCGVGGSIIAAVGLVTSISVGCVSTVIFFIITIAGTTENLQGFQLRSASLTLVGALVGGLLYAVVAVVSQGSAAGTFFAALLPIAFLSALRTDKSLMPMPPVANIFLGFFLITRFGDSTSQIPRTLGGFTVEAVLAWLTAVIVNLVFPDRAGDLARRLVAHELRRLGAAISAVGTNSFSCGRAPLRIATPVESAPNEFSILLEQGLEANAKCAGLLPDQLVFNTPYLSDERMRRSPIRSDTMLRVAENSLAALYAHHPAGRTRLDDFADLARAESLTSASVFEPRVLPEQTARWRNAAQWSRVIQDIRELVAKVASLESASFPEAGGKPPFSRALMLTFFGEAYFPLWVSHFASCAAACAKMSTVMCKATCRDMFVIREDNSRDVESQIPDVHGNHMEHSALHRTVDARKWNGRRAAMYYGFLLRYRLGLRRFALQKKRSRVRPVKFLIDDGVATVEGSANDSSSLSSESGFEGISLRQSATVHDLPTLHRTISQKHSHSHGKTRRYKEHLTSRSRRQALSFFAITGHAMSEEIAHIQKSMTLLAATSDAKGLAAPLYFLMSGLPELWKRTEVIVSGKMSDWELQFAFTHTLLLSSILALALFIPFIATLESSEVAWVFTSAALAAQLSAEPTLFIGAIRVVATVTGALLGFGFNTLLNAWGRASNPHVQLTIIPYVCAITIGGLLLAPPSFRYAAFLVTVTNAVILFCPRATPTCSDWFTHQTAECFPDWRYTLSRTINVSIGVVFALAFHLVFWPRFANKVALKDMSQILINASRLFAKLHRTYFLYGMSATDSVTSVKVDGMSDKVDTMQEMWPSVDGDVFRKDDAMVDEIRRKVSDPLSTATAMFNSEANIWQHGPLRSNSTIPRTLADFVALSVTLLEMASILGRRPIYSASYGRSVYEHYINPMLHVYETIQISLLNLAGAATRAILNTKDEQALRENSFDLHLAVTHISKTRGELRKDAEQRSMEFKRFSAMALAHRKPARFHGDTSAADESLALLIRDDIGFLSPTGKTERVGIARSKSFGSLAAEKEKSSGSLSVDDVVLYDAFTFIADGCLSSLVRIAVTVLLDSEKKLKEFRDSAKAKKRRWGRGEQK